MVVIESIPFLYTFVMLFAKFSQGESKFATLDMIWHYTTFFPLAPKMHEPLATQSYERALIRQNPVRISSTTFYPLARSMHDVFLKRWIHTSL